MAYLRRRYRVAADQEEMAVADLWMAGTLGIESETAADGVVVLTAYFDGAAADPADALAWLAPAGGPGDTGDTGDPAEYLPEIDWMAEYRRWAQPFALGSRLVVDPREPEPAAPAADPTAGPAANPTVPPAADPTMPPAAGGRRLLRLPARTAFGIGSHESTALAIALLEAEDLRGRRVLDVGTGTGVLAFAALAWGAAAVVAFDVDPEAAFQARLNSRLNGFRPHLFAGRPAALAGAPAPARAGAPRPGAPFDLALVNVVPEQILPDLGDLLAVLSARAGLILSGLLAEQAAAGQAYFAVRGLVETSRRSAGEWVALRLESRLAVRGAAPAAAAPPPGAPGRPA